MDEEIVFNDLDDNDWEYSIDAYWESIQISQFEAYMDQLKYDIQEEKKYGHIKDEADRYYYDEFEAFPNGDPYSWNS